MATVARTRVRPWRTRAASVPYDVFTPHTQSKASSVETAANNMKPPPSPQQRAIPPARSYRKTSQHAGAAHPMPGRMDFDTLRGSRTPAAPGPGAAGVADGYLGG